MLKVNKQSEPDFYKKFKKKEKPTSWSDYNKFNIKTDLKKFMLENEQDGYCPYCEQKINFSKEESHIEHIKPRNGGYPELFQTYDNMITCCNEIGICGNAKQDKYDDVLFINPVEETPEEYITYEIMTGKLIPKYNSGIKYEKAAYTINLLNLNQNKLTELRKRIINMLNYLKEEEIDGYIEDKEINFIGVVKYFKMNIFKNYKNTVSVMAQYFFSKKIYGKYTFKNVY